MMDVLLDWYEALSRENRDRVDQALHFLAAFVIACAVSAAGAWSWAHNREFFAQAPIERIEDTERDMRFMLFGAGAGQIVHTYWVGSLLLWLCG